MTNENGYKDRARKIINKHKHCYCRDTVFRTVNVEELRSVPAVSLDAVDNTHVYTGRWWFPIEGISEADCGTIYSGLVQFAVELYCQPTLLLRFHGKLLHSYFPGMAVSKFMKSIAKYTRNRKQQYLIFILGL